MITVESLVVSLFQSNCYLVRPDGASQVLVVDPGDDAPEIIRRLRELGVTVAAYLITHGHVDHVSALADVYRAFPAPVAMHPSDSCWAFSPIAAMPPYYDAPVAPPEIARVLNGGQVWEDLGLRYRIIETPGHSPGGVAFYFSDEKALFAGDSLFRGSIGRSDLPGADPAALAASLQRLLCLPDDTVVYGGHGPATTIGREKRTNPFLQDFSWAEG